MRISPIAKALIALAVVVGVAAPVNAAPMPAQTEYILVVQEPQVSKVSALVGLAGGSVAETNSGSGIMVLSLSEASAASLRALGVEVSERNTSGFWKTATPAISSLRGLDRLDEDSMPLDSAFAPPASENGSGVTIYVVDSGVVGSHEVFGNRVQSGATFVNSASNTSSGPGNIDPCDGHGTHVAGIAAGTGIGVAPGATIVPVRVFGCARNPNTNAETNVPLDENSRSPQQQEMDLLRAFEWINNHHQVGQRAVVNLSLGGDYRNGNPIDALIKQGQDEGIVYVGAAGNDNKDSCSAWPAAVPGVLSVGAFSMYQNVEERSSFSNYGSCVDLSAPGGHADLTTATPTGLEAILSAWPFAANGSPSTTSYAYSAGTSQASPFVAGAVARYLSANPTHTGTQALQAIYDQGTMNKLQTSTLMGSPNRILYIPKSGFKVSNVTPTPTPNPTVPPTPTPTTPPTVPPTPTPTTPPTVTPTPTPTTPGPTVTPGARPNAPKISGVTAYPKKVTISWAVPQGLSAASVVRYEIRWTTKSGVSSWSSWETVKAGPKGTYTITNLPSRLTRYVQVRAITASAVGQPLMIQVRAK
jgi:subtilisin family serine protease